MVRSDVLLMSVVCLWIHWVAADRVEACRPAPSRATLRLDRQRRASRYEIDAHSSWGIVHVVPLTTLFRISTIHTSLRSSCWYYQNYSPLRSKQRRGDTEMNYTQAAVRMSVHEQCLGVGAC